jgi:hypothetical protein
MTAPDRCPHCGVSKIDHLELDNGEVHDAKRCRDYLVAERDRLRENMKMAGAPLEILEYMGKRIKTDALESFNSRSPADPNRPMAERYGRMGDEIESLAKNLRAALAERPDR